MKKIARRDVVVGGAAAMFVGAIPATAIAQSDKDQGLLKRLQVAKMVRVGIANQPPFSALNPDGTLTGAAPTISQTILHRLGIPKMEGLIASYGELIPGMLAGRWDFVSASLTITPARCAQVLFADPLIIDGSALFYKKGKNGPQPKSVADIVKMNVPLGVQSGGADYHTVLSVGVAPGNVVQFTSDQTILDGLLAKRVDYALTAHSALVSVLKQRKIEDLEVVYPVADDPPKGSSCVFRKTDTDMYDAYQKELRAMKASGEYLAILQKYGFDMLPQFMKLTADEACAGPLVKM